MKFKKLFLIIAIIIPLSMATENVSAKAISNDHYTNYYNIEMTNDEYNRLLNLGFTEQEIYTMDLEEYNNNKNLNGEVVAEKTKYYQTTTYLPNGIFATNSKDSIKQINIITKTIEITEEEYNKSNYNLKSSLSNGYVETNYKKMTTTIIAVNGRYRYKNTLQWKKLPSTRSYDIIGIGIDTTVSGISSTKYIKTTAGFINSSSCYYKTYTSATWKLTGTGYAATFKLPEDTTTDKVNSISTYMYFEVQKLTNTPIITLNAYGDYAHAQKKVSSSVGYGVSIGNTGISFGVSVTPSVVESFDSMSTAQATLSGLYW